MVDTADGPPGGRVRRPSAKVQATQGKHQYLHKQGSNHSEEDLTQEKMAHQQEAIAKAKKREEHI